MENWNNNKVTSNKEAKKKLNGHITYRKLINDFLAEVKLISAKVLTEDLINW